MRSSRSLSNIPLPSNFRRDSSKNRDRPKSVVRNSREKSADLLTPLAYRTSDRKWLFEKQRNTPSTPFSACSSRYRPSSIGSKNSLSVTKRDRSPNVPSLHKLMNDKKWLHEQYIKVQGFIQSSGLFPPDLAGMIKPPTIKTFVELMSILLKEIISTVPINSQNYTEIVLSNLKLLRYPGSITMSTIKSANTMHGWPHFITIVSWLIDRVTLSRTVVVNYDEESQRAAACQDILWEYKITRYNYFSEGENGDYIVQAGNALFNDLTKVTDTDLDGLKILEENFEKLQADVELTEHQIEELTHEHTKIQQLNQEKKQVITQFQENKGNREQEVEEELVRLKKLVSKEQEKKEKLTTCLTQLQYEIANQTCKIKEKNEILNQIEDLKRVVTRKEKKIAGYRLIQDDLDRELKTKVVQIESKVDAWNVSVTKTFLPDLQHLHLREKGFHCEDFLKEILEMDKERRLIEKGLLEEFKSIQGDICQKEREKIILKEKIKVFLDREKRLDDSRKDIEADKEKHQKMLQGIEDITKTQDFEINHLEQLICQNRKDAENLIKEYEERIQQSSQHLNLMAKKGMAILIEAHNMTLRLLARIDVSKPDILYLLFYKSVFRLS